MKELKIIIVGNLFSDFSNQPNVFNYDQFQDLLNIEKKLPNNPNTYQIYLGQGLHDYQIKLISQDILDHTINKRFRFAGKLQQAKRFTENSMISEPENIIEQQFQSVLMLNESNIESQALHLQSQIVIEAATQMLKAVSEKYLITTQAQGRKSFLINQINTTFFDFIFPLEVKLKLEIIQIRAGLDDNLRADASIQIRQENKLVACIDVNFSLLEKDSLINIEKHIADSIIKKVTHQPCLTVINKTVA